MAKRRPSIRRLAGAATVLVVLGLGACGSASEIFSGLIIQGSSAPTPLPDGAKPATQYPSEINISTANTSINSISIIVSLTHDRIQDLDLLLVGPTGIKVMLMSDCLGNTSLSGEALSFNHTSSTPVPTSTVPPPGVAMHPTDNDPGGDSDAFYSPAPGGPYGSDLAAFLGSNPNGTWRLYAYDDTLNGTATGEVGGWQVWLNTE